MGSDINGGLNSDPFYCRRHDSLQGCSHQAVQGTYIHVRFKFIERIIERKQIILFSDAVCFILMHKDSYVSLFWDQHAIFSNNYKTALRISLASIFLLFRPKSQAVYNM